VLSFCFFFFGKGLCVSSVSIFFLISSKFGKCLVQIVADCFVLFLLIEETVCKKHLVCCSFIQIYMEIIKRARAKWVDVLYKVN